MKPKTKTDKQAALAKKKYKVTNWKDYNQSLVNRGAVTVWLGDDVINLWNSPTPSGKAGHPKTYSDLAIRTALTIQAVYHLPLRATEGFVQSLLFLMGCAHLKSPDYSTLSYRASELDIPMSQAVRQALVSGGPLHIAVDSAGVKIYGEGEWKVRKHGWTKRRTWRKVHLGVDVSTNLIPTSEMTHQDKADAHMVEPLLNQMPSEFKVASLYGDGAYDDWDIHDLCMGKRIKLVVPPRANARDQYYEPGEKLYHRSQTIRNYAKEYLAAGDPVISVDTKRKELIGEYASPGREWRKKGTPRLVKARDFGDKDPTGRRMKVNPYGVYDVGDNDGYVTVGITHDTSEFAVQGIRNWWNNLGRKRYPKTKRLLITPDAGGSNGYRVKLWKYELQRFADESGLTLQVCHFPRGTSKWNKIEHRLFSFITDNWQGRPLTSYQVVIDLIAATTTTKGLRVYAELDDHEYQTKRTVSDEDMAQLNLIPDELHPELNYVIAPRTIPITVKYPERKG